MVHSDWTAPSDWKGLAGWKDSSYGNDTCPSWTNPADEMIVFVEYPEGERECSGTSTYTVYTRYDLCDEMILATDSYDELLAYLNLPVITAHNMGHLENWFLWNVEYPDGSSVWQNTDGYDTSEKAMAAGTAYLKERA